MDKFKVGDKVKLVRINSEGHWYKKYLGNVYTIKDFETDNYGRFAKFKETSDVMPYVKNLELVKDKYTYEDLKKAPIGTKIFFKDRKALIKTEENRFENGTNVTETRFINNHFEDKFCGKIIKIEEPTYTTVYEFKEEILDEAEKRYLRGVIRPFRDRVKYIQKFTFPTGKAKITIKTEKDNDTWYVSLPLFEKDSMYKNMKPDKEYTLEELGL